MVDSSAVENKADLPTSVTAVSRLINEYFFPGGGIWKPMSVKAPDREQAEAIYKAKRDPVSPVEKKVEESETETNNA